MKNNSSTSILSCLLKRFFATAIDLFLLSIFFQALGLNFSISAGFDLAGIEFVLKNGKDGLILYFFLSVYFGILEGIFGSTLGKFILKEKVVNLQGGKASLTQALLRNSLKPIEILGGGFVSMFLSKNNQSIGDRISKTLVINRKNGVFDTVASVHVNLARKILGILFLAFIIIWSCFLIISLPKINAINAAGESYFLLMKKAVVSKNFSEIYQASSDKLKQQLTPDDFEQPILEKYEVFKNSLFKANSISFYQWKFGFGNPIVYLAGETDTKYTLEFILLKENENWKLVSFHINQSESTQNTESPSTSVVTKVFTHSTLMNRLS